MTFRLPVSGAVMLDEASKKTGLRKGDLIRLALHKSLPQMVDDLTGPVKERQDESQAVGNDAESIR